MEYISTRNTEKNFSFKDIFLKGLAPDGGLYVPKKTPYYSIKDLEKLKDLSYEELSHHAELQKSNASARDTQKRLAEELTKLVHGTSGLHVAEQATKILFGDEIQDMDDALLSEIFADVPSHVFPRSSLDGDGLPVVEAIEATGLTTSRGAARRTIAGRRLRAAGRGGR